MKILHTADIHLAPRLEYIEDAGKRAQRREDVAAQADAIPRLAREHGCQAVVIAGDAFDRDLPAQAEVARLARALEEAAVPVLITPGTHDPWRSGGVWDRAWPANVHLFKADEWETVLIGEVAFHGLASLGRPRAGGVFEGLSAHPGARFQVGIAHASMLWADVKEKVDRKNYPFEPAELDGTPLNYLALGDHHRSRIERRGWRTAAYPGSPEGIALDPAEAGDRCMLVVTLDDPGSPAAVEPVKVNRRQVYLDELDLADLQHEHPVDVGEEVRRQVAAAASPERLARFDLVGVLHHALEVDLGGLPYDEFFLLQVRDRTRTVPEAPADLPTIRAAFERRLAVRLAEAGDEREREQVQRALALGIQALEGLPL